MEIDKKMGKVFLGNTGLEVSRVGLGVLPIGPSQLSLPVNEGAAVIRYALEAGINFIDTAQYYKAYPYISQALKTWGSGGHGCEPVISSKCLGSSYEEMAGAIEEARIMLSRDYVDIFLLHEVRSGQLARRQGAWECLNDAKAKGLVKAIGLSTHHVDVTLEAAKIAECDVIFPLINYAGLGIRKGSSFGTAEEMLEAVKACSEAGKGVFSMKVFGGGNLTAHYRQALDYVFSKKEIQSVMIGFGKTKEIDDILAYTDGSMAPDYNPDISMKRVHINHEDCIGCGACKAACASDAVFYGENGLACIDTVKCITCGYCSPVCPVRAIIMY